jgi:hypothetical protein
MFLGIFIFLGTEEYNCIVFLGNNTEEDTMHQRIYVAVYSSVKAPSEFIDFILGTLFIHLALNSATHNSIFSAAAAHLSCCAATGNRHPSRHARHR